MTIGFDWKLIVGLLALLWFVLGGSLGCASSGTPEGAMQLQNTLTALEAAGFEGDISFAITGRPLAVGTQTEFYAGPGLTIHADGHVSFADKGASVVIPEANNEPPG